MMLLRKAILALYALLIVVLAAATFVERSAGTPFVSQHVYGAWWFSLLWALLTARGVVYIVKRRMRKWNVLLLHLSLVVILAGALLTHLTSSSGTLHLRQGQAVDSYSATTPTGSTTLPLPFIVRLDRFEVVDHPGTSAASDYVTRFSIADGKTVTHAQVSMNKIFTYRGIRFYQSSYDTDNLGSILSINSDRWGIPVTYTGYALLFFSLLWLLVDPKGTFRRSLRQLSDLGGLGEGCDNTGRTHPTRPSVLGKSLLLVILLIPTAMQAQTSVPRETADRLGNLLINYNDRICPVETYALDFVQKIHGSRGYKDYSAEQVLLGWTLYPEDWAGEPFIRIKSSEMRRQLGLGKYASVNAFFRDGEYILGQPAYDYAHGTNKDAYHKACADIDGKLQMIMTLRQGAPFMLYPYTFTHGRTMWFSPFERFPKELPHGDADFIGRSFATLFVAGRRGDFATVDSTLDAIARYQQRHGGTSLPSKGKLMAEHVYNRLPYTTLLFIVNLTLGLVAVVVLARQANRDSRARDWRHSSRKPDDDSTTTVDRPLVAAAWLRSLHAANVLRDLLVLSLLALTTVLALRWRVSGTIPLGNGYETTLAVAWMSELFSLLVVVTKGTDRRHPLAGQTAISLGGSDRLPLLHREHCHSQHRVNGLGLLLCAFAFLISGFFLLVSHISLMDPAIGPLMPVLNSPLLSIHVSFMMMSYAFLAITFFCGLFALLRPGQAAALQVVSRVFLYPAIATLGIGIFLGAVWANVSWGSYWSWDPKETWALITFMLYAVALHTQSLPRLSRPRTYHIYMVLCFLSILMTYFGVNYLLTGMHSYA